MERVKDHFRDFDSIEDYVKYKVGLLNSNRYKAFGGTVSDFARRVKAGGYATDPDYVKKLKGTIASLRNGGIIKFDAGNTTKWLAKHFKQRKSQLGDTEERYGVMPKFVAGAIKFKQISDQLRYRDWDLDGGSLEDHVNLLDLKGQYKAVDSYKEKFGDDLYIDPAHAPQDSVKTYINMLRFRRWAEDKMGFDSTHQWTTEELEKLQKDYSTLGVDNVIKLDVPEETKGILDTFKPEILSDMLNKIASNNKRVNNGLFS